MLADNATEQREVIAERVHLSRWRMKPRPSQRSLSLSLGWGENRLGQIERADPNVDLGLDEIFELADALRVDVNYLIGHTDTPGGGHTITHSGWTRNVPRHLGELVAPRPATPVVGGLAAA